MKRHYEFQCRYCGSLNVGTLPEQEVNRIIHCGQCGAAPNNVLFSTAYTHSYPSQSFPGYPTQRYPGYPTQGY